MQLQQASQIINLRQYLLNLVESQTGEALK